MPAAESNLLVFVSPRGCNNTVVHSFNSPSGDSSAHLTPSFLLKRGQQAVTARVIAQSFRWLYAPTHIVALILFFAEEFGAFGHLSHVPPEFGRLWCGPPVATANLSNVSLETICLHPPDPCMADAHGIGSACAEYRGHLLRAVCGVMRAVRKNNVRPAHHVGS